MAPAFHNAWYRVMGQVPNLCAWHITRNWGVNLCKIKDPEKKKLDFKSAKTIQQEMCKETFSKLLASFTKDLLVDNDTAAFGTYFLNFYTQFSGLLVYCFRKNLGINTNMHLESLHKKIKYQYLEGKQVKRLDVALDGLLKLLRDLLFDRLIKITNKKKSIPSDKLSKIMKSHKLGLQIAPTMVTNLNENLWQVQSMEGKVYDIDVQKGKNKCGMACLFKCTACKICIHAFTCSCIDNVIRGNICKHIHCVAKFSQKESTEEITCSTAPEETEKLLDEFF